MDSSVKQIMALAGELHGYVDKLRVEAADVADRAGKLQEKAEEYDGLCKAVSERKAELASLNSEYSRAEQDYAAFRAKYLK